MKAETAVVGSSMQTGPDRHEKGKAINKVRQTYFVSKQLRMSVAVMVLWSFLAVGVLNFITMQYGKKMTISMPTMGYNLLIIGIIFVSYISVFFLFILRFSNRFIGPFERLKKEINLFVSGRYNQRLAVRDNDDIYIRSFLDTVNRVLVEHEKICLTKTELLKTMDEEIISMLAAIENKGFSPADQRRALLLFSEKMKQAAG